MRFIDLFAGLGGFNLALSDLSHKCVFACEVDAELRRCYELNFGLTPSSDIRRIPSVRIPEHDILCAGFPCQPFSKAGEQQGLDDPNSGDLFNQVLRVLEHRRPHYLILENVPNLERHDRGRTWARMERYLTDLGYAIRKKVLSPHRFGIAQIRERLFVVGARGKAALAGFQWPEPDLHGPEPTLASVLDHRPREARQLTRQARQCLDVWQQFLQNFPAHEKLPSFPIWSMEFGATYPYEDQTPHSIGVEALRAYRGSHGQPLAEIPIETAMDALPSHARVKQARFPTWKRTFIRQNRELYSKHRDWIDDWRPNILEFPSSLQKFEWNCQGEVRDIWRYVIQFRASGVRVKRPTTAPSLVAMTSTQVPVIAWEQRYMTVAECARLQGMAKLDHWPSSATKAFGALGNAVNVDLVGWIAEALLSTPQTAVSGEAPEETLAAVPA